MKLEPVPIALQRAIVCLGTCCFRARALVSKDWLDAVQFSWVSDKRRPEADMLRLARKRGGERVAELFGHRRITGIVEMRQGLTFPASRRLTFRNSTLSLSSTFSSSPKKFPLLHSISQLEGLNVSKESRKKCKYDDGREPYQNIKGQQSEPPGNQASERDGLHSGQ